MVDSITKTLGAGSGIDIGQLVTSLVDAQYSTKAKLFETRNETLATQISTVASLKSGITGFASALANLVKGGSLATQPTSSNTGIVKASTLAGSQLTSLSHSVEVRSLASPQVVASPTLAAATELGAGQIKIQFGSYDTGGSFIADATDIPAIDIDAGAGSTLSAIAAKINATADTGVTASIITDGGGQRLVLKGANGAERAFTVTATGSSDFATALNVAANDAKIATHATDARVAVDGVEVRRTSNSIDDLIPGVRLDLQAAAIGTRVALGTAPATDALKQAVNDVVATFNELYKELAEATNPVNGPLARDPAAQEMKRQLRAMTLTDLTGATDGSPKSLAEIGVTTNRDGTLSVDSGRLTKALATYPAAVETMFTDRGVGASGRGLSAALNTVSSSVTSFSFGLGASEMRYGKAKTRLVEDQGKLTTAQDKARTRLTQQFASMDSRVAAYKATQTFLQNQIDAWNKN
ncbi:flagellar filament capping protein FliD [Sphingomonas sp.]|uniref:flagellar filament capping protein FliD n=1 Tax=Sphingomonas sp. TaxID=28214 RepID=UPI002DD67A9D|nr:flagellar filament capping protein FliD [Sphingomonas sp.]